VGPRAVLGAVMKRKIPFPRRESNPRTKDSGNRVSCEIHQDFKFVLINTLTVSRGTAKSFLPVSPSVIILTSRGSTLNIHV
jgi:hypothetical protein